MRSPYRKLLVVAFSLLVVGTGAFWMATTSHAARTERASLPSTTGDATACDLDFNSDKEIILPEAGGTFNTVAVGDAAPTVAVVGKQYVSASGLKTVQLQLIANGGHNFAEGIGNTYFWLDASRPVTSAIWEKRAGTDFPAIQEMRFNFFYTFEAMPGRVFRSVSPAVMRADDVRAFPPPRGTVYRLVQPVELEDVAKPGIVVGKVLTNRLQVGVKPEVSLREQ